MKTEQQHILAHLKFLEMFTVLLVRLGLHSSVCFIFSLLTFTMEIGVSCFIIIQGFHLCYYRYYNKYYPLQRSQASALCPTDLQKNTQSSTQETQSSTQETQCSVLWLLLGFDPSSTEPCIEFCTSRAHVYSLYSSGLAAYFYFS